MKRVFISHNSKDKPFVRSLAAALERYGILSWVDEAEILPGDSLVKKISDAIDNLDFVIAVISHNSIDSGWVRQELEWALTKEIKKKKIMVIPVLVERCDIPFFLLHKLYADFTDSARFPIEVKRLAVSINRDQNIENMYDETVQPKVGESVVPPYRWTNFNLIAAGVFLIWGMGFYLLAGTLPRKTSSQDEILFQIVKSGLSGFGILMVLGAIAGAVREVIYRGIIYGDPNFSRDVGMIRVGGFLSIRYLRVLWKYRGRNVVKALILIDLLMFLVMLGMISILPGFIKTSFKFINL